jgi:cytochrome bd-type quinol oxidase subunit 2
MIAMWYAIVSLMLIIYVVLDGRNLALGCFTGLSPGRRRSAGR